MPKMRSIGQLVQKLSSGNSDTQTDRQTDMCKIFTYPLSRAVKSVYVSASAYQTEIVHTLTGSVGRPHVSFITLFIQLIYLPPYTAAVLTTHTWMQIICNSILPTCHYVRFNYTSQQIISMTLVRKFFPQKFQLKSLTRGS